MTTHKQKATRILIVDDHVILRDGLVSLLRSQPDFEVVGEAGSIAEALLSVRKNKPDLVLMDYNLPDGTGLEATREILAKNPEINVVFLTVHEEDDTLFGAIRSGAKGYLLKNIPATDLIERLREFSQGKPPLSGEMTSRILEEFARTNRPAPGTGTRLEVLTSRELEVLQQIVNGASNKTIADSLFISVHTVKNHVHSILDKLGVDDRHDAANLAHQQGMVPKRID